jgi:hypothetical protein
MANRTQGKSGPLSQETKPKPRSSTGTNISPRSIPYGPTATSLFNPGSSMATSSSMKPVKQTAKIVEENENRGRNNAYSEKIKDMFCSAGNYVAGGLINSVAATRAEKRKQKEIKRQALEAELNEEGILVKAENEEWVNLGESPFDDDVDDSVEVPVPIDDDGDDSIDEDGEEKKKKYDE